MKFNRFIAFTNGMILICLAFLLGGCVRTLQPVLLEEQLIQDHSLIGRWTGEGQECEIIISHHPQKHHGNKQMNVRGESPGQDPAGSKIYNLYEIDQAKNAGKYLLRVGKVDNLLVAEVYPGAEVNLSDETGPGQDATAAKIASQLHVIPVYSFWFLTKDSPDQITMKSMKWDWFSKYIKAHPDELMYVGDEDDFTKWIIVSPTKQIQAFLLKHINDDGALFPPVVFRRAGSTTREANAPPK